MSGEGSRLPSILVTLGLTGALGTAVSCGPCLKLAIPDTGAEGDTGDTADDDRPAAQSREAAAEAVLERGVLPEDVAKLLAARLRNR